MVSKLRCGTVNQEQESKKYDGFNQKWKEWKVPAGKGQGKKKKKKAILFLEEIKSQIRFSTQKCVTNATVSKILALLGRKNKIWQIKSKAIHRLNYHLVVFYFTIVYNQRWEYIIRDQGDQPVYWTCIWISASSSEKHHCSRQPHNML